MAIDRVCKMRIEPETTEAKAEGQGKTHCFCAPGSKSPYERDPEMYPKGAGEEGGHHSVH